MLAASPLKTRHVATTQRNLPVCDRRRQLLTWFLAGSAAVCLPACGPKPPLVVASHVWPGYEFMFLARDEGWLTGVNLQLLETLTATDSISALKSGKATAAALTLDEVLLARAQGIPLTVVLVFDVSAGADKIIAKPGIYQFKDLEGKRIGVEPSTVGTLMLNQALKVAGMTASQLTVVPMTGEHRQTWDTGQVDAVVTYEPVASQLIADGGMTIFDSRLMPDLIFDVLAVRTDALTDHEDALRALLAAHFRGLSALLQNPNDTYFRLAKRLQLQGNEVATIFRGIKLPTAEINRAYLLGKQSAVLAAAAELSRLMVARGELQQPDSLQHLISDQFLERK